MMTPDEAALALRGAEEKFTAAVSARVAAENAVETARTEVAAAEEALRQAQWLSVTCPVCDSPAGTNCVSALHPGSGILHTRRMVAYVERSPV